MSGRFDTLRKTMTKAPPIPVVVVDVHSKHPGPFVCRRCRGPFTPDEWEKRVERRLLRKRWWHASCSAG